MLDFAEQQSFDDTLSEYGTRLHFGESTRSPAKESASQIIANMSPLEQSVISLVPSFSKTCESEVSFKEMLHTPELKTPAFTQKRRKTLNSVAQEIGRYLFTKQDS